MPSDFSSQGIALEDAPDFSGQGEALESPRSEYNYLAPLPSITAEQLGEEHVSHPALPIPTTRRVAPPEPVGEYDYLPPLPPITEAQLAEDKTPWSQRPAVTILAPRNAEGIGGIPRIPTLGEPDSKLRAASEFAQTAQETLAGGVEGMTTPEAVRTYPLFAIPYVGPALAAVLGTKIASGGLAEVITGAELHDPRIAGSGFGKVLLSAPLLRAGASLPRSKAALTEEARVAAAKDITPREPLQIPERFVESPLPEIKLSPPGGPENAIQIKGSEKPVPSVPLQPAVSEVEVPAESRPEGVREGVPATPQPEISLTDPVGNTPEFYSLPRLRALDRSKDPRLAAAKKYYGAKTVPELARLAKARFDEMAAKAKPLETREDAEMKRVQALPEGPEGEAQLVAEDIAKAVETVDVTDVAGVSPVPALVRIIRRAARDPAMKTAAEQAMRKIGAAAREQGVPLTDIKNQIAGELKAIYGADAPEMAKAFFGEEPKPAVLKRSIQERTPDIIDEIQGRIGKLSIDAARKIREKLKPVGAARKLFTRSGGNALDTALDVLHREGLFRNITTEDAFLQAIEDASGARKGARKEKAVESRAIERQQAQRVDFERAALEGIRTKSEPKETQPISVNDLFEGDEFQLAGTKVKIKEIAVDPESGDVTHIVLEDGQRFEEQTVGGDAVIYPDKGTLKQKEVEFLPPESNVPKLRPMEKSGELFQGQDQPFNLAGEKTIDVERIAREKAEADKTKKEAAEIAKRQQTEFPPGPGAASPSEFAERTAKGAGAEPPKGPPQVTIDANAKPSPEVARKAKDFNIWNKANSGQWTFYFGKLGEAAKSAWDKMTLSAFKIRENVGRDTQRYVDNLLAELPRPIRRKGGRVFFDALDGKPMDVIESEWAGKPHGEAVISAARQVKARLEEIRTTIRDTKRESYNAFLMGLDRSTLAELFDNNISRSIDTSKYTKEQFSDALTRNEFPDDWGISDGSYLTHLFTGTWKVTAKLGETPEFVTRAKTVAEAKAQIFKRVKENPDYANADWKIEQDTVIPADMIRLGDRRFWNLVQRMKDNLGVTASEVKQAQQGIIGRKASKQKWFGSLQQRRGFQGYSHDFRQTMTSYLSGFHRWLELTKLNREVQPLIEQVRREGRTSAAEQLDILMENLWGKPPKSTVLFDNFIREIPGVRDYVKPLALDRWSRNIRSTLAFLTLRTARFAVVNRLQPLQGLYPLVGERILAQSKIRQHTAEGRALLDEAGVRFDPGQYGGEATSVKSTLRNIGERFSGERSNQELAFLAMFQHGTESGLSRAEAINYAKLRGQLLTQFTPVITDIPPIMRGPFTSLLFQFKRFPIKQAELLFKMVAKRQFGGIARWLGVMAAAGGLSYFMRQFLIAPDKRDRLRRNITDQHGQGVADAVMYGLPGLVNTDLSGSLVLGDEPFGSNIYEKIGRQVTGPAASMAYENIKAALTEPRESTTETQKAVDTLRKIPTLRPIAELIALEQSDLDVRTPDGETKYRKAVRDALVNIGSFRTATESNNQMAINGIVELEKQSKSLKNAAYVALTTEGGNGDAALEAIQKFNERWPEVAITGKELKEYIQDRVKGKGKTDYERLAGKKFAPLLPEQP